MHRRCAHHRRRRKSHTRFHLFQPHHDVSSTNKSPHRTLRAQLSLTPYTQSRASTPRTLSFHYLPPTPTWTPPPAPPCWATATASNSRKLCHSPTRSPSPVTSSPTSKNASVVATSWVAGSTSRVSSRGRRRQDEGIAVSVWPRGGRARVRWHVNGGRCSGRNTSWSRRR